MFMLQQVLWVYILFVKFLFSLVLSPSYAELFSVLIIRFMFSFGIYCFFCNEIPVNPLIHLPVLGLSLSAVYVLQLAA